MFHLETTAEELILENRSGFRLSDVAQDGIMLTNSAGLHSFAPGLC